MFWKKIGLVSVVFAALGIVAYAQTGTKQRAHSSNFQVALAAGYLGAGVQELSPERVKSLNLKQISGVEVKTVAAGAPADKVGIRVGDIILEVNGQKVEGLEQFAESIGGKAPGVRITLTVFRNGANLPFTATLATRPPDGFPLAAVPMSPEEFQALIAGDAPRVGFEGEPITTQMAEFFGVAQGEGVLVRSVGEKTPAEKAGLKAGDVVTKVNGMPVARPGEIAGIVRISKKAVVFTVVRNKKEITLNVEIARNDNLFGQPEAFN